jgi:putative Mg2+ transporter-C (MgtC) family protein
MFETIELESFGRVALAGALGGLVGLEREISDKPAGLRTHVFVAAGSALLVLLAEGSIDFFQSKGPDDQIAADPIRVLQAIVVGISFLGAGTIVHHEGNRVEGLTTASSIYFTAGIGIAVALERTGLAIFTTIFALLVLVSAGWIERCVSGRRSPADSDTDPPSEQTHIPPAVRGQ